MLRCERLLCGSSVTRSLIRFGQSHAFERISRTDFGVKGRHILFFMSESYTREKIGRVFLYTAATMNDDT